MAHVATHERKLLDQVNRDVRAQLASFAEADQAMLDALHQAASDLLDPTGYEGFALVTRSRLKERGEMLNETIGWFASQRQLSTSPRPWTHAARTHKRHHPRSTTTFTPSCHHQLRNPGVMAPSTLGTFLRSFTFGHVRQLEAVVGRVIERAWGLGAGPTGTLIVDVDSTICQVHGYQKQGAAYGYTRVLGYHPLLATRADTGEVLHARLRKGSANTARGIVRFVDELLARLGRAGGGKVVIVRADSGFYQDRLLGRLSQAGVGYTVTIPQRAPVRTAIDAIAERAWQRIDYPDGEAHVAECVYRGRRLIVRRVRNHHGPQGQLFATWRYHAFVTNLAGSAWALDRQHRAHAVVELSIRDLKAGPLAHLPSGSFHANSAWLQCAVLAHNLIRWTAALGGTRSGDELVVAKTFRHRLLGVPGRLVNRSGRPTLRLPARWPWADQFRTALDTLRALPPVPG